MRYLFVPVFLLGYCLCCHAEITCFANAGVPPLLRSEGVAERTGEIILNCQGGSGVQTVTWRISLSTALTSRVTNQYQSPQATEALLLVDEPGGFAGLPQVACPAGTACPPGSNVFQGVVVASNAVEFRNIPLTAPGPAGNRVLRFANLRADASMVPGVGIGLVPPPVTGTISFTGNTEPISVMNVTQTVGFVVEGLSWQPKSNTGGTLPSPETERLSPCRANNRELALNKAATAAPEGPTFRIRINEGFASAFLARATPNGTPVSADVRLPAWPQNVPGFIYNTESGLFDPAYPATGGMNIAGLATQATRFQVRFQAPPGFQIHAPVYEVGRTVADSRVRLVNADANGGSGDFVKFGPHSATLQTAYNPGHVYTYEWTDLAAQRVNVLDSFDLSFHVANTGAGAQNAGEIIAWVSLAPRDGANSPWSPRFEDTKPVHSIATIAACPAQPLLRASISAKAGDASARVWTIRATNSGVGTAANAKLNGLTLRQTFGAACTPVVTAPALPAALGSIAPSGATQVPVTINFSGCASTARFSATVQFAADGAYTSSTTLNNQYR